MGIYAEIQNSTITNTVICDAEFAAEFSLVEIDSLTPQPGVGWTTTDGGTTWQPPAIPVTTQNQADLHQKAATALTNNAAFLAITSPTNAQAVAQVQALTRQMNAVIRLMLGLLDTTSGT